MIHHLRNLIRKSGLAPMLSPWLTILEDWRLRKLGSLEASMVAADCAKLTYGSNNSLTFGPPAHFAQMACSRHELPTLLAFLHVFSKHCSGGVAWDIGGNAGFYGAVLDKLVGTRGRVYGFEPVPLTYQLMKDNLQLAGCTQHTPVNIAISDVNGDMPMSFDPDNNTVSSLHLREGTATVNVRVATGDALVASGECAQPTVIKLDIEGHELKALKGMSQVLAHPECKVVLCEIHFSILAASGEADPAAVATSLLREAGFTNCKFISRSHLLATKS